MKHDKSELSRFPIPQNQIATLGYDGNGNTTTDENGDTLVYDAWNRLVAVKNSSGATIAAYTYDALGRRITEAENGSTTDLYYSINWQVLEERQGSTVTAQNIWSPFYVDQLAQRTDSDGTFYAEQDANYNTTSLTDTSGNVVERYIYDPYGNVTVLNADGTQKTSGILASNFKYLYQGKRQDGVTGDYDSRNRVYDPTLGRFLQEDPAGYINGLNTYQCEVDDPISLVDPSGTAIKITYADGHSEQIDPTAAALENALANAAAGSIVNITITGHSGEGVMYLGDSDPASYFPPHVAGREHGKMNDGVDNIQAGTPNKEGVSPIIDGNGHDLRKDLLRALAPGGRITLNGCNSDKLAKPMSASLPDHPIEGDHGTDWRVGQNTVLPLGGSDIYLNGNGPPIGGGGKKKRGRSGS